MTRERRAAPLQQMRRQNEPKEERQQKDKRAAYQRAAEGV